MEQNAPNALETRLAVQKLSELPAMSMAAQQFLAAVADPNVEIGQFAHIIESDPALLARVIGVANSAYFSRTEPVTSAEDAIFRVLGLQTTKSLVLGIILSGPFDARRCSGFSPTDFWLQSIFAATLAQHLAPLVTVVSRPRPPEAYLAGLVHKIGLLALVHLYPEAMQKVIGNCRPCCPPDDLQQLEHKVLSVTDSEVGSWLARKWHLPTMIVDVIANYTTPHYRGSHWPLAVLTGFCARWAVAAVGAGTYDDYPGLSELEGLGIDIEEGGKALGKAAHKLDDLRLLVHEFANG